MQLRPSLTDDLGARLTSSVGLQAVCIAWVGPAVALAWTGSATAGLRAGGESGIGAALDRTQAATTLLAIFTLIGGLMWAVRTWDRGPSFASRAQLVRLAAPHALALLAALVTLAIAVAVPAASTSLVPISAVCAFWAGLAVPRLLMRAPLEQPFPVVTFATVVLYQLTMGWLHTSYGVAGLSWLLIAEGLVLAWAATAAARVVGCVGREPADRLTQAPALRRLPEPAVGR